MTGSYATNLGGLTITPGVYSLSGAASLLTGTVVLDAQNNSNAIFVFLLPSAFTTGKRLGGQCD